MIIGVPRETHRHEHRVGLNPFALRRLSQQGHTVLVESRAGESAHFTDLNFQDAGGQIVYNPEEIYRRSDLVCRVGAISKDELPLLKPESVVCAFHHLAVMPKEQVERLMRLETTLIGYEVIQDEKGDLPVLLPTSEMAGQMAVHIAAHLLQKEAGGRGILLGTVAGVPPPTVVVLGAGTVGRAATRLALASGAHVIVLDDNVAKLQALHREFGGRAVTVLVEVERLQQYTAIADALIGAILIPGARAPFLVTEAMVKAMKPGSVIIDVSIDQGGCVETSRPTTLDDPTFTVHGVVHYCVGNMTANIPRTASRALASASVFYIEEIAGKGLDAALREDPGLAAGVYLWRGTMVNERVGAALGLPAKPLSRLLDGGR
jgi:alanine dehydrogenase